jgi:hypothetical protein
MSYYKEINGIKYDKKLLDIANEKITGQGDGRISENDMQELLKNILDRNEITTIEYLTILYIIKNYNITQQALEVLATACSNLITLISL